MAIPTFVYIAADSERNLRLGITKFPDVERLVVSHEAERLYRLVFLCAYPSLFEAQVGLARLTKLRIERRTKLVDRNNPYWIDLCTAAYNWTSGIVHAPPLSLGLAAAIERRLGMIAAVKAMKPIQDWVDLEDEIVVQREALARLLARRFGEPPAGACVGARLPIGPDDPVRTREAGDAKPLA